MARPFKNFSSANKAFGVFSEPQNAGDYIIQKKTIAIYCNANKCVPSLKIGSQGNYLLYKQAKKLRVYPYLNSINKANLNINLITKLDLTNIDVIQNFSTGATPTTITTTADPFLDYNIDPSGNLFGSTICDINNFVRYMVYDASYNTINPHNTNSL
jgi:hypothetical protein